MRPARISKLAPRAEARHDPVQTARLLKTDAYGIRIENLELVIGADISGAESR